MEKRILVFMHDFRGGGAEKVAILLANGFVKAGCAVEIVVLKDEGPMRSLLLDSVEVTSLNCDRVSKSLFKLIKLLRKRESDLIISHMTHVNTIVTLAAIATRKTDKLCLVEHNMMSKNYKIQSSFSVKLAYLSTKFLYRYCDKIVAVSSGVKDSIIRFTGVSKEQVVVIFNPVVDPAAMKSKLLSVTDQKRHLHPFFEQNVPVLVGIGSLTEQKNFELLIESIPHLIKTRDCRVLILGEGPRRNQLQKRLDSLGLSSRVDLVGFVDDPAEYLISSSLFVLSSKWEGLPTVVIEALATGTKILSTDCPSGPNEILVNGKYGELVALDASPKHFADKIKLALDTKVQKELLFERAEDFSIATSTQKYLELIG